MIRNEAPCRLQYIAFCFVSCGNNICCSIYLFIIINILCVVVCVCVNRISEENAATKERVAGAICGEITEELISLEYTRIAAEIVR